MKKIAIIDIDGTIANIDHRLHWIKEKPRQWKKFESNVMNDIPIGPNIERIGRETTDLTRVFLTGRSNGAREQTVRWLHLHVPYFPGSALLFMRDPKDYRPAPVYKCEVIESIQTAFKDAVFEVAYDDTDDVLDMLRKRVKIDRVEDVKTWM